MPTTSTSQVDQNTPEFSQNTRRTFPALKLLLVLFLGRLRSAGGILATRATHTTKPYYGLAEWAAWAGYSSRVHARNLRQPQPSKRPHPHPHAPTTQTTRAAKPYYGLAAVAAVAAVLTHNNN